MIVDLDKESLIDLVKGSQPNYNVMDGSPIKELGQFTSGIGDKWWWRHSSLVMLTEEQLYEVHMICKNSFK